MRVPWYGIALLLAVVCIAPLRAQQTGTIRGRVTDDVSQLPLRGGTVSFGTLRAETRPDGGYLLENVPAGTDSVRVTMIGYAPLSRAITVVADTTVDVD